MLYSSCFAIIRIPESAHHDRHARYSESCWLPLKTYLSSSVDDFCRILLGLVLDGLAERILNGRIVALDEMSVDELDGERGFACRVDSADMPRRMALRPARRSYCTDRPAANNGNLPQLVRRRRWHYYCR